MYKLMVLALFIYKKKTARLQTPISMAGRPLGRRGRFASERDGFGLRLGSRPKGLLDLTKSTFDEIAQSEWVKR